MPKIPSSPALSLQSFTRKNLDMRKAVGEMVLCNVHNDSSKSFVCQAAGVDGKFHQAAFGLAIAKSYLVMQAAMQDPKHSKHVGYIEKTLSWGQESSPVRLGNVLLTRLAALGAIHTVMVDKLALNPGDKALGKEVDELAKSIVNIGVKCGKCPSPPTGMADGGPGADANTALRNSDDVLVRNVVALGVQGMVGGVAKSVLPEIMAQAIQERLSDVAPHILQNAGSSFDLMQVLERKSMDEVQGAIEKSMGSITAAKAEVAVLGALSLPEFVVEGQTGGDPAKDAPKAQDAPHPAPAIPQNVLDRSNGSPVLYNYSPNTVNVDFSELVKSLGTGGLTLQDVKNFGESEYARGVELGRAQERAAGLEQQLAEKNKQLAEWDKAARGVLLRDQGDGLREWERIQPSALLKVELELNQPHRTVATIVHEEDSGLESADEVDVDVPDNVNLPPFNPDDVRDLRPEVRIPETLVGRGDSSRRIEFDSNADSRRIHDQDRNALQKAGDLVGGFGARLQIPRARLLNPLERRQDMGDGLQQSAPVSVADRIKQFEAKTAKGESPERVAAKRSFDQTSISGRSDGSSASQRNEASLGKMQANEKEFTRYLESFTTRPEDRRVLDGISTAKVDGRFEVKTRVHGLTDEKRTLSAEDVSKFVLAEKEAAKAKVDALIAPPGKAHVVLGKGVIPEAEKEAEFLRVLRQHNDPQLRAGSLVLEAKKVGRELMDQQKTIAKALEQNDAGRQTLSRASSVSLPLSSRPGEGEDVALSAMASRLFASIPRVDIDRGYGSIDDIDEIDDAEYPDFPVDFDGSEQFAGDDENVVFDQMIEKPRVQEDQDNMMVFSSPYLRPKGNVGRKDDPAADRNMAATW